MDFANMAMKIFSNLQNVKDGAAALKVGFEDFAMVRYHHPSVFTDYIDV